MSITLELQPDVEKGLLAQAEARGVSLQQYLEAIVAREAGISAPLAETEQQPEAKNLYDLFADVRGLLTNEEIDRYFTRTPSFSRPVDFD